MARLASLSFLNFPPAATGTKPTSTNISALITSWYAEAYTILYGPATYSADESTDTNGYIDSVDFRSLLDRELSDIANQWHDAGTQNNGQFKEMPSVQLDKKTRTTLESWRNSTRLMWVV
jgi:hypothetical protein